MAIKPDTNDAFLREVDDELRRDQMMGFWSRWGVWVAVAIVAALLAFAGYLYWQHRQEVVAGERGEKLQSAYNALGQNQPQTAATPLADLAGSGSEGYATLAKFTQADILLQKPDLKEAAAKFAAVANDKSVAQPFRDLALVRQTSAEYDTLKPQVVVERLRPLAVAGNPWFGSAGELVAVAYIRMNRSDLAGEMFGKIARDETVPESIRQRAVQMAGAVGVDAVAQPKTAPTQATQVQGKTSK